MPELLGLCAERLDAAPLRSAVPQVEVIDQEISQENQRRQRQ
ncbi:hypothetical protein O0544_03530 [Edwardsiella anguillarum]|nr:hypothetical protein [Edwardsiella anguillarum]